MKVNLVQMYTPLIMHTLWTGRNITAKTFKTSVRHNTNTYKLDVNIDTNYLLGVCIYVCVYI